jgi:hypothetical protein
MAGRLIGPSWNMFINSDGNFKYVLLAALVVISGVVILIQYLRKKRNHLKVPHPELF